MRDFLVPDLGEGLEDATITSWSVAVGDDVALNQTLCTVETNKAEVEIPSPYAGRIVELGGAEGETLAVGAVLVRIATDRRRRPKPMARHATRARRLRHRRGGDTSRRAGRRARLTSRAIRPDVTTMRARNEPG